MSAVAGWYPDPEGDTSRLRYWDGTQWTDNYTPIPTASPAEDPQVAQAAAYTAQPTPAAPVTSDTSYQVFDSEQIYPMTSQDRVLRLIAFILNIISCVGWAWLIIPLAWMIPMTVISWGIYKGTRTNTVAFGVCTLIFVDLISVSCCSSRTRTRPRLNRQTAIFT